MQNSDPSTCPTCHLPIAADAPGGLCPACTLAGAAAVPPTSTGGHHSPAPSVAEIAPHFPELEILELLGAGGMGAVYKARQPQLDRTVALKLLSRHLAQDPAFVERFNREARVLARLSHPNIVAIFDFGTAGPYCYLLMEYVDGVNLRQAMRTGGFTPAEALALVQDVCAALQFAHEEGILHRDIKPENILIDSKGRVKIADFGIAKLVGGGAASDVTLTLQGSILGSPHYMAPEQFETPGDVDQRADIYSLGVVLYEMLTGGLPIGRFALPSEKAAMDARIDEIVLRTLEKERERRYQTVSELKTGFERIESPAAPSQAAFITDQILGLSRVTFWIAMILLAPVLIDAFFGAPENVDDLLKTAERLPYLSGAAIIMASISGILRAIHKHRTQGRHPARSGPHVASANSPIQGGQEPARFSLASAILTGCSLMLAVLFFWIWAKTLAGSFDGGTSLEAYELSGAISERLGFAVLIVLVAGVSGILGIILGCISLGKIRQSDGQLSGFGLAAFATVTWPLLLACSFGDALLPLPMPGDADGSIPTGLFVIITLVTFALSAIFLIRGLARWAKGVPAATGGKLHPGFGASASLAAAIMLLGPSVSAKLVVGMFGAFKGDRDAIVAEVREGQLLAERMVAESESTEAVRWRLGKPEVTVALAMQEGQKATLRAFLRDAEGNTWDFKLGDASYRPELPREKVVFEFGTELYDTMQRLVITRSVPDSRLIRSLEDLRGWEFNKSLPEVIIFDSVGKHEVQIAANKGRPAETLILEVVVTQ